MKKEFGKKNGRTHSGRKTGKTGIRNHSNNRRRDDSPDSRSGSGNSGQRERRFSGAARTPGGPGKHASSESKERRSADSAGREYGRTREGRSYRKEGGSSDRRTGSFSGGKRSYGKPAQGERRSSGIAGHSGSRKSRGSHDSKERRSSEGTAREYGRTGEGRSYRKESGSSDRRTGSFTGGKRSFGKSGQGERKFSGIARPSGGRRRFADNSGRESGRSGEGRDHGKGSGSSDRRTGSFTGGKRSFGKSGQGERKFSGIARPSGGQRRQGSNDLRGRRFTDDGGSEFGKTSERTGFRKKTGDGRSFGTKHNAGTGRKFEKGGKSPAKRVRKDSNERRRAAPKNPAPAPVSLQTGIRLNKFIAESGLGSRRTVDEMIGEGRVDINGITVKTLGVRIDPEKDKVTVDGETVRKPTRKVYILLNKPKGIITSVSDEKNRTTVIDILNIKDRVFPVGRLDYDTSGLLLLTNDGELANLLMHPSGEIRKTYHAKLSKPLEEKHRIRLSEGVFLEGKRTAECEITYLKKNSRLDVLVTIHEGRNRQVRKIFESYGYFVRELERTSYAGIEAGNLKPGEWRMLDKTELETLYKMTGLSAGTGETGAKENSE
ncbi:MAG: pseudouridine synthase [Ignavibacteria bacterium]|nr:pseudouridine synthase [Ignavibacteria bacterium]